MPQAQVANELFNMTTSTQTRTTPINLDKIRKIGEAIGEAVMFGTKTKIVEDNECATRSVGINYWCGQHNGLVAWVSSDVRNNSVLLKILATEIASGYTNESDYVLNSERISEYSKKSFNDDIADMLACIRERKPLDSPESTISLAKRVAAMDDDSMDSDENIDRWARNLANDISKGND